MKEELMMISEQKIKEVENSAVELAITVKKESLSDSYTKVLQKYSKTLQLPGFRKGKAPTSVLEQKFGPSMKQETIFQVIDESVQEALEKVEKKYKPLPYSQPALVDETVLPEDIDKDLNFVVTYDIMPLFELPTYTDIEVEVPKVKVLKADIDEELKRLQNQNALVVEKTTAITKDDIVTLDSIELDDEDKEVEASRRTDFTFTVGTESSIYKIDKDVIGLKVGDNKVVEKEMGEKENKKKIKLSLTIKEVKQRDVPALDDEFAQDVSEQYKTLDDLVKATKTKLEESVENKLKAVKLERLVDKMLENTKIEVPKTMIEVELDSAWRRFVSQWGLSEEQTLQFLEMQGQTKEQLLDSWALESEKGIRVQLLLDKIKDKEGFKIEKEALDAEIERQLGSDSDEQTRSYYGVIIEDDMKLSKTNDFLLEKNKFTDKENLKYSEFMES
jgi:trigger factor